MVHSIVVPDEKEIQKLAVELPNLLDGRGRARYKIAFSLGADQQLILYEDGIPVLGYKVPYAEREDVGMNCIENYLREAELGNRHIAMLYDNPRLARSIEFQYIKGGLEGNEQCVYVMSADDVETQESIVMKMRQNGIDTALHLEDGSLKFVTILDPAKNPEGFLAGALKNVEVVSSQITSPPARVVAHQRYQFNTDDEILGEYAAEMAVEAGFREFPGSLLCNHYVHNDARQRRDGGNEWNNKMLAAHDGLFFVSSSSA